MTFLYPNVLYALILPALLAAAAWWLWRRRSRKWEVLVSPEYRRELVHAPATWHRVLPVIFAVLASIFAITELLMRRKELGRKLRGGKTADKPRRRNKSRHYAAKH